MSELSIERKRLRCLKFNEPLPTTKAGLKNHVLFAAKSLLSKREVIHPSAKPLPTFMKGTQLYSRSDVWICDTREGWLSRGRGIPTEETPAKLVTPPPKLRLHQSQCQLFGLWQTHEIVAPSLINGRLPINKYGNIELLYGLSPPNGTVHIKDRHGARTAAKNLKLEHASVVVEFDCFGGKFTPKINGVVVHIKDEAVLLKEIQRLEDIRIRKEKDKKFARVIKRWETLVKGLVIRDKLRRDELN
eukprot:NODE_7103_length_810_cov_29.989811_g6498_i0.p1 GENE.NODE_7103_length_810_cov_29.989811_g6498_i0~~NODE_7103_length_810_cov_29.989811_g6498_i0.p1  ORF type:complete len:266 (+),score=67.75 NODE_7103_length_810_cov_29.989811_g6498_i0:65-799(+)